MDLERDIVHRSLDAKNEGDDKILIFSRVF